MKSSSKRNLLKYLGVVIDNKLTWNQHNTQTNLRLSKGIGVLYKLRSYASQMTLRSLYFPSVQSNLLNWGNAAATNIKPIKTSLNKAVRAMAFKDSRRHANSLYKKLKILPLDECYKLQLSKFMWKVENNKLPGHTASKYITITHYHNTRQTIQSNLQLSSVRLDCAKRSTIYSGTRLWLTDVPLHIKSIRTLNTSLINTVVISRIRYKYK